MDATDEVVLDYSNYIRSELSFYSGLPHESFNDLQDNIRKALNEYIATRNSSVKVTM